MTDQQFNDRPVYAGEDEVHGIWFYAGSKAWIYGKLANIDLGKSERGLLYSTGNTVCPSFNNAWNEWLKDQWTHRTSVVVESNSGCCSTIRVAGLSRIAISGSYTLNGTVLNERPVYISSDGVYGLWYKFDHGWIIDNIANIESNETFGYVYTKSNTSCPSSVNDWMEWWRNAWSTTQSIVSCAKGDLRKYNTFIISYY